MRRARRPAVGRTSEALRGGVDPLAIRRELIRRGIAPFYQPHELHSLCRDDSTQDWIGNRNWRRRMVLEGILERLLEAIEHRRCGELLLDPRSARRGHRCMAIGIT